MPLKVYIKITLTLDFVKVILKAKKEISISALNSLNS